MSGTFRPNGDDPPVEAAMVDRQSGGPSTSWRQWFQSVARVLQRRADVTIAYDPPSIAAGVTLAQSFTLTGTKPGDLARATFAPGDAGVIVQAAVLTANQVTVYFTNVSASPVDLAAGTIFLAWERRI
jgi:hypothetical protein